MRHATRIMVWCMPQRKTRPPRDNTLCAPNEPLTDCTVTGPCLEHRARSARNTRPEVGALLGDRAADGGALHLTLGVDNDASVVLEVDEASAVHPPPRLAL